MSRSISCIAVLATVLAGIACVTKFPTGSGEAEISPKLLPLAFYESGAELFTAVDGQAAQWVKEGEIVPLGLGLANLSKGSITFNRESFVLESEDGSQYPLVSLSEFKRDYKRSRTDARLSESFLEALTARFASYAFRTWRPFPFSGEVATANDEIELARRQWTHTYLYFPWPKSGVHGKEFVLLVRTKQLPETLVVRFTLK